MHAISSNFPSSCGHFEGGLGDFPHQEGTRILHIPPLPIDVSRGKISQPGLVYKLKHSHSHSAPAYTVVGDLITCSDVM